MSTSVASDPQTGKAVSGCKWVCLAAAKGNVAAAARMTLGGRLDGVRRYLPLAALNWKDDSEYVHRLRVATRRAMAAIEVFGACTRQKPRTKMVNCLRIVRRSAGKARDLDVMLQRIRSIATDDQKDIVKLLKQFRRQSQPPIEMLYRDLGKGKKFRRMSDKLLAGIDSDPIGDLGEFSRRVFRDEFDELIKRFPMPEADAKQLHQLRIQSKSFRYTIEILHEELPINVRTQVYPIVCEIQERLGQMNDHACAAGMLKRLRRGDVKKKSKHTLKQMQQQEEAATKECIEAFGKWWTPEYAIHFQDLNSEIAH